MTLYGFTDGAARDLFVLLQTVTGVGPRLAMAALAVHEPAELAAALARRTSPRSPRCRASASEWPERLTVELRDKVGVVSGGAASSLSGGATVGGEVTEALVGLGSRPQRRRRPWPLSSPRTPTPTRRPRCARACPYWGRSSRCDDGADEAERTVSVAVAADGELDANLRPRSLADFIGQAKVREQLELVLRGRQGARRGHRPHPALRPPDWARRRWP